MPVIVDPQQWESASRVMGGDVAGGLTAVHRALVGSLQHTGGMGGADSSGQAWAGAYELCATALMGGLAAVQHGALKLASLLQRTGFNHALAEQMSGGGTPPVDTAPYATNTWLLAGCGDIPQPAGGAANYPEGWSLVKDHLHYEWPNADLGDLHAAATAWTAAQTSLTALTSTVDLAVAAVREQSSPEVADAALACGAVSTHLTALAAACGILASGCLTFAQAVASAQSKVKNLLVGLAVQAAAVEAAGAVAAFLTFGTAEVAAQATLAYEITSCVEDVVTLLSLLQSTSAHAIAEMKPVVQTMIEIENDLAPLLGTEVVAAETTQAPSARSAAEQEREKQAAAAVAATVVLASAANAPTVDLDAMERSGGHTIQRHVGRTESQLRARGIPLASTFPDLATAERVTSANLSRNHVLVDDWLAGARKGLTIRSPMSKEDGSVYDRSADKVRPPTEVVTRLLRKPGGGYFVLTSYPDL